MRTNLCTIIACCLCVLASLNLQARPVSYPTGTTIMQMNDADSHSLHIHYSPTARYSLGYKAEKWNDQDWQFHGLQYNHLAKRWNQKASQANIYFKSAIGVSIFDDDIRQNGNAAGFVGISGDWENRRFFTMYENRYTDAGEGVDFFMQKARVGVAPYLGDYGDFHTWIMLQTEHQPERFDQINNSLILRFFKSEYLFEIGIDENEEIAANLIIRL